MYKQIKDLMPSGKIEVTPEQSEAVQKSLFEMGYVWGTRTVRFMNTDAPFFYWHEKIEDRESKHFAFGFSKKHFNNHENPLHHFNDYFKKE